MKILTQQFWIDGFNTVKALWRGIQELAENASLIAVSGFTVWSVCNFNITGVWVERALFTAAVAIALRGLVELAKDAVSVARARSEATAPAKKYSARHTVR